MEDRIRPTRSGLFSIELMIAVGVFTLCAAICVGLFVRSELISRDSADLVQATAAARSVSECYKAAHGDLAQTAALTGADTAGGGLTIYYDRDWNRTDAADPAVLFHLFLTPETAEDQITTATVNVVGEYDRSLLSWQVAAWEVEP